MPTAAGTDFDLDAALGRRFAADAAGSFASLARRLKEALPDAVTLDERRRLFGPPTLTGLAVELGDKRFGLALEHGRPRATVSLLVRGVVLNTRTVPAAEWFASLRAATAAEADAAAGLSRAMSAFASET